MRMKEAGGDTQTIIISFSVEPMVKLITDYEQAKNKLIQEDALANTINRKAAGSVEKKTF